MDRDLNLEGSASQAATATTDGDGLPVGLILRLLVAAVVVAAIVIFVLQNLDNVPVDFLSWSFEIPLVLLLAIAMVEGVVLFGLFNFWRKRR